MASEQLSPSEKLSQAITTLNAMAIEQALNEGANPFERGFKGPASGLCAIELLSNTRRPHSFSPKMWSLIERMVNTTPQTREDTQVLQASVLSATQNDAFATTLMQQDPSNQENIAMVQGSRKLLATLEGSRAWLTFKSMLSFPSDFGSRVLQAQKDGQLDAELEMLKSQTPSATPIPSLKPSFAVGKDNNHQQDLNRNPSVSNTSELPSHEQPFINQLGYGHYNNELGLEGPEDNLDYDNDNDEVGDYHDRVPKMSVNQLKAHKKRRLGQPSSPSSSTPSPYIV